MSAEGVFGGPEGFVEASFANIGLESVDVLQGGVRVEGQAVGPESHNGAIFLVDAVEFEVAVSA